MFKIKHLMVAFICLILFCPYAFASEVVPADGDTYVISTTSARPWMSGSALMDKLHEKANLFCEKQNKVLVPISGNSQNWHIFKGPAKAEFRFRCIDRQNPGNPESENDEILRIRQLLNKSIVAND